MIQSVLPPPAVSPLPMHCPVTGLPVYSHSSWTYSSPGGRYRLRVSFIGERIVWLQPQGYVRRRHVQKGVALLADVLLAMLPETTSFFAVDDYSAVKGASLNARRAIIQHLRQQQRIQAYIVYGASTIFRLGLELSRRLAVFPFDVMVVRRYEDALAAAQLRSGMMAASIDPEAALLENATQKGEDAPAELPLGSDGTLTEYASELLDYVGGINLEPYGIASSRRDVAFDHPFRPVYDALAILRDDMQAILRRHRKARENLEQREKVLIEKQALLNETHTTLKILLSARQEERRQLEVKIKDRFNELLLPLLKGLAGTRLTPRQRLLHPLVVEVIGRIGTPLLREPAASRLPFTAQERMIAYLIAMGLNASEIAETLGLSRRTIENHCQRMRGKAGLKGRRFRLKDWLIRKDPDEGGTLPRRMP